MDFSSSPHSDLHGGSPHAGAPEDLNNAKSSMTGASNMQSQVEEGPVASMIR